MFRSKNRFTFAAWLVILAMGVTASSEEEKNAPIASVHERHARQLHRLIDPFGLLGKAGEVMDGAVGGMKDAVEGIGKTLDEGAQQMGKMIQEGATNFDSAFKEHLSSVGEGMEEAGKVAKIVSEDLVDSVSSLVNNHLEAMAKGEPISAALSASPPSSSSSSSDSEDEVMRREGMVDGVLRMFGIDSSQIGLMALNVLIFLAEMITSSLIGEDLNEIPETRGSDGSMFSWLLNRDPHKIESYLKEAQDPSLPRHIIEKLVASTGDSTACVQLLVCKMSPIIWGVQGSVRDYAQGRSSGDPDVQERGVFQSLYDSLPPLNDFMKFSQSCEKQFQTCPLLSLSDLGL